MPKKLYENGQVAADLDPQGVGSLYYPSGRVAVQISPASEYQNRFYAFDKDKSNTVLLGVDEFMVGFTAYSKRRSAPVEPRACVLTRTGGLVANDGAITDEWRWENKAKDAKAKRCPDISIDLNESLIFKLQSRTIASLEFSCENVRIVVDMGTKQKRTTNYLDTAVRQLDGKLIPQIDHVTLQMRQVKFNEDMNAQRNRLNPRSENLTDMVSGIVSGLEKDFDHISDRMNATCGAGTAWRADSLAATLREIPKITLSGTETGLHFGFGDDIYTDGPVDNLATTAPAALLSGKGTWKGSLEIGKALKGINPPLRRNRVLDGNSGRYSNMLVADKRQVTALNPSGGAVLSGTPLRARQWEVTAMSATTPASNPASTSASAAASGSSGLKQDLSTTANSVLTAVLVTRGGNVECLACERVAEVANNEINIMNAKPDTKGGKKEVRLVKVDISENPSICKEFGIKSIPTFLIFRGPELIYGGPLGGRRFKVASRPYRPQILLIEPNFGQQIQSEKMLKKMGCDPFLCLTAQQASDRVRRFSLTGDQSIVFDLVLISQEVPVEGLRDLTKCLTDFVSEKKTIAAIMASALGEHGKHNLSAVDWSSHYTTEVNKLVSPELAAAASCAIVCPLKSISIEKLLDLRGNGAHSELPELGLTPDTLVQRLNEFKEGTVKGSGVQRVQCATGGGTQPYLGIKMSAEDTKLRGGKRLVPLK
jgi:hypothetical protein